jgi:signal transduction histidine kinase/phage shock protein PspC (stress-responsive transcriptional regulator)
MSSSVTSHGGQLRRDPEHGLLGGVCAGIAAQLGFDVLLVRIAFVALTFAGGIGLVAYALIWALVPASGSSAPVRFPALGRRGGVEVGIGVGLLVLAVLLTCRALGVWWSDAIVWPLVGVAAGGALLWRGTVEVAPPSLADGGELQREEPAATASRTGLGIALVVIAGLVFLGATGALSAIRSVLLSVMVVAVVLGVIFGPWIVRLGRSLAAERAERIRSEERAEISAHLHDSVLQTLALVQQRSEDPRAVEALARRQERELRAWLGRRAAPGDEERLGAALEGAADEVERDHAVRVEVVTVGDAELDDGSRALVAAAREAMVNAAKFGGGSAVDVFAEAGEDGLQVYVRDRGPGFDPERIAADRRGVRESIVGRMQRHGGRAVITSRAGEGTEIELSLPVRAP